MPWHEFINATSNLSGFTLALLMIPGLLFLPERNKAANRALALLLGVLGMKFFYDGLSLTGLLGRWPHVIFLQMPLIFLYGPLLLIYLEKLTNRPVTRRGWGSGIHLLPFSLILLCYLPALGLSAGELRSIIRAAVRPNEIAGLDTLQYWLLLLSTRLRMPLFILHLGIYLVLALRLLHRHRQLVVQYYSNTAKVSLAWLANLLWSMLGLWLLVPLRLLVFGGQASADWLGTLLVLGQVVLVFLLGLFGLWQKTIALDALDSANPDAGRQDKYATSPYSGTQLEDCRRQLLALMAREKPYLDCDLSLPGLAALLSVPTRQLSQLVNGTLNTNFLDFVNRYRIEEAKRLLDQDATGRKVIDIALSVGFNSKSPFYTAFRRHVGMTPSQYRAKRLHAAPPAAEA